MISGDMSTITGSLANLREELCDHAVHGAGRPELQLAERRDRALTAVMVLISAASEVAREAGIVPAFQAWCAMQVPKRGLQ